MEPIYFGQKPPLRPVTENIKQWNVGALNIQGCKEKENDGRVRETSAVILEDSELDLGKNTERITRTLSTFTASQADLFFCELKPSLRERKEINHPTLKPLSLMRRLTKLVTPLGGVCLDPFMGSGTTVRLIGVGSAPKRSDILTNAISAKRFAEKGKLKELRGVLRSFFERIIISKKDKKGARKVTFVLKNKVSSMSDMERTV